MTTRFYDFQTFPGKSPTCGHALQRHRFQIRTMLMCSCSSVKTEWINAFIIWWSHPVVTAPLQSVFRCYFYCEHVCFPGCEKKMSERSSSADQNQRSNRCKCTTTHTVRKVDSCLVGWALSWSMPVALSLGRVDKDFISYLKPKRKPFLSLWCLKRWRNSVTSSSSQDSSLRWCEEAHFFSDNCSKWRSGGP